LIHIHYMGNLLMSKKNNIIILTGPTGVGKTNVSIKIAEYIPEIEIISADSMLIYKYLNIGTDKPKLNVLNKYPHHCINIIDPSESFDAVQYTQYSNKCIEDVLSRNKKPLIVGGTGLYIKSFLKPIFDGPGKNSNIRARLNEIINNKGNTFLYNKLKKIDPDYSSKISPNDIKRIIRALEVFYITGKNISYFHKNNKHHKNTNPMYNYYTICLLMERNKLYQNINERVEKMIENGLIEETKMLVDKYKSINLKDCTAMQGLGYKQILLYLKGFISKEEAIESIKKETRHFSKRQLSWFKNQLSVDYWINIDDYKDFDECSREIIKIMKSKGY
jgi:tRNA dimethylallyltransferase